MFLGTMEMEAAIEHVGDQPIGYRDHINHEDCPSGTDRKRRLYIHRVHGAWLFYCHHCGSKGALKDGGISRAETLLSSFSPPPVTSNAIVYELNSKSGECNIDKWPVHARLWWLGYELDEEDALMHNVQWLSDRLWLDANPHAWQGRTFDSNQKQKYLTYIYSKSSVPKNILPTTSKIVVITEDVVSSYKVYKAGYNSVPLLGTKLHSNTLNYLTSTFNRCIIWLDDDVAGMLGSVEAKKQLAPLMDVTTITYKQPKEVGLYKLQEMIRYA